MINTFDESNFVEEMRRNTEKEFLRKVAQYDSNIGQVMRAHGYKRINKSERTVLFTFGEITFSRSRWCKNEVTYCPVDEWLGLKKYSRLSNDLVYHLSKLSAMMSYRQVCKTIKLTHGLDITKDSVLKSVKLAGKLFSEKAKYRLLLEKKTKKISPKRIYIEGDGVMIKTCVGGDERKNTDLSHFLIHTGVKDNNSKRRVLENKHEIINTSYEKAREELLDYLFNNFEITDQTILITNSDNGKGYTKETFKEIKNALGIKKHEHFWDAYHLNEKIINFFKPYPFQLCEMAFKAIQKHDKELMRTVFDTVDSLIYDEEEFYNYKKFRRKLLANFSDTKPAKLRGLSTQGIGVMESQHRKITYRMKHRGMHWSISGANTMAQMIVFDSLEQLEELFYGDWRTKFKVYEGSRLSAGHLVNHFPHSPLPAIKNRKARQRC
ncbi:TPA: ISLre2 family transposase [Streptococcus agalactiae]|nr:ISLre2 family transposase [Streptococcus agalactiae]